MSVSNSVRFPLLALPLLALVIAGCSVDDRNVGGPALDPMSSGSGGSSADAGGISASPGDGMGGTEANLPTNLDPGDMPLADACSIDNGGCDPLTVCTPGAEGPSCGACPSGYTGDGVAGCVDVDECETDPAVCPPEAVCLNQAGSYGCEPCPGEVVDGICTCGAAAAECRDVDECATDNGGCDARVDCVNTLDGRTCGACPGGYTGDGELGCADVDECLTDNGGCDELAACVNTSGSFTCGSCPSGFTGGGATGCIDVNECADGNNGGCDARTQCTNTPGSRTCGACPSGFSGNGQSGCIDINECNTGAHDCFAASGCSNSAGTFSCSCPAFFAGDGRSCSGTPKEFAYLQMIMGDGALYTWNSTTRNNVASAVPNVNWASFSTGAVVCGVSSGGGLFCWEYATPQTTVRIGNASNWQKLEGSITAVCGIQSGGNLFCWENGNGGVGSGSVSGFTPVAQAPQGNWTAISVGDYNGKCGIRNGQLFCWGRNVRGMLGTGAGINTIDLRLDTPQRVGNASDWTSVSVGEAHVCGIRGPGQLFCWGAAFANAQVDDVDAPVRVGDATDWVAVGAGVAHSVGVRANGQLFYWGQGFFGAFPSDSQTPLRVGADRNWQPPVYADYALSCATSDGVPYCFGSDANTNPDLPPTDIPTRIRL